MFKSLETTLNLETKASKTVLHRLLKKAEKTRPPLKVIRSLRSESFNWSELVRLEEKCNTYFDTKDTTKIDAISQLSFQDDYFRSLNDIPFILIALSLFKIFMVPTMAILMPIFAFILPYILLRFIYKIPMTFERYTELLKTMWIGKSDGSWTQTLFFLFSLLQGIIQPIQNAIHYNTTDKTILEIGQAILGVRTQTVILRDKFARMGIPFYVTGILYEFPTDDPRRCFMTVFENPTILKSVFENLGELEVLWKIAKHPSFREVTFLESCPKGTPYLHIEGLQDLSIPEENRILSSVKLDATSHHCLVTGPNGGGKSSSMRAILQSVIIAQTFGVACVTSMTLRPFKWISSGLDLRDTPGVRSMFQTEVRFAASLLKPRQGPGLILYDELFHSTNPPDCIRTANIFMERLWKRKNIASFLSTHVFELVDKAPPEIQRLCVSAKYEPAKKRLDFSYKLSNCVCKVSSVYSILKREGLMR